MCLMGTIEPAAATTDGRPPNLALLQAYFAPSADQFCYETLHPPYGNTLKLRFPGNRTAKLVQRSAPLTFAETINDYGLLFSGQSVAHTIRFKHAHTSLKYLRHRNTKTPLLCPSLTHKHPAPDDQITPFRLLKAQKIGKTLWFLLSSLGHIIIKMNTFKIIIWQGHIVNAKKNDTMAE